MNNTQTGAFIKELHKEKGLTQKELADQLYITDRAVSKWERGLCAPDIATLEPLAKILDVTVSELIAGERLAGKENMMEIEKNVQNAINYSEQEITEKSKKYRKKTLIIIGISALLITILILFILYKTGNFFVIAKSEAPDHSIQLTFYDKPTTGDFRIDMHNSSDPVLLVKSKGAINCIYVHYGIYEGIYWAPDSSKYILAIQNEGITELHLIYKEDPKLFIGSLSGQLTWSHLMNDMKKLGYTSMDELDEFVAATKKATYQFVQWSADSQSVLISYSYPDAYDNLYQGCLWYNCETGQIEGVLDLTLLDEQNSYQ